MAAPGKLVAEGSPVTLKRTLGEGYTVQVSFNPATLQEKDWLGPPVELLQQIRTIAPHTHITASSPNHASYQLKTGESVAVQNVLQLLDNQRGTFDIASYDILGTSIEDIFLELMNQGDQLSGTEKISPQSSSSIVTPELTVLELTDGRPRSALSQTSTIFHKRALIVRRSWLTPLLLVLIAVAGSCIPLVFIKDRPESCTTTFRNATTVSLYLPSSPIDPIFSFGSSSRILTTPPNITSSLGATTRFLRVNNIADNTTFVDTINQNFQNLSLGGISIDLQSGNSLVAWEATPPGLTGPSMLNLATNILFNSALNSSGNAANTATLIQANYESFPPIDAGTLVSLKWVAFFGAAMVRLTPFINRIILIPSQAVFPAFFSLYVSRERRSSVQAMQLSNGLANPIGLWLGHLAFDSMFTVLLATIIIVIFAVASNQFHGLGLFVR